MLLKKRLANEAEKNQIKWDIVEQDYVLSWVLQGISCVPELKNSVVFKGGTALRKCYFGNYRFSQDLDFSVIDSQILEGKLDQLLAQACEKATQQVQYLGENVEFKSSPYIEKRPHPEGQKAYVIQCRLPWHRDFYTTVYGEFSFLEKVLLEGLERRIIHPYDEPLEGKVYVYPLEEIIAEKMRALLQFAKKLHERGWGRSRVRDYYDLWRILKDYKDELNLKIIPELVAMKCDSKGVPFLSYDDIFQEKLKENIEKEWQVWLGDVVPGLPDKTIVVEELREMLSEIFKRE